MPAAIGDLYFALTSASGFWTFDQMAGWQAEAGLTPRRPIRLISAPGQGLQIGVKPRPNRGVGGSGPLPELGVSPNSLSLSIFPHTTGEAEPTVRQEDHDERG